MEVAEMNLAQKLSAIRKMVAAVKKSASGYNYTYSPEDEVLAAVTAGMNKYGVDLHISIDPSIEVMTIEYDKTKRLKNGETQTETVHEWGLKGFFYYKWINIDNPEDFRDGTWFLGGQQQDLSQAFGSAMTYCTRYFYLKYFQIATTKDDPDNYRSKQKLAEDRENSETAKAIITALHAIVTEFIEKNPDKREDLLKIIPKYVIVNGKPSKDYFKLTDPDAATALQTAILDYIEKTKKEGKKA